MSRRMSAWKNIYEENGELKGQRDLSYKKFRKLEF